MLKSGPRSAWPRWLCMEQSMATFSLPTDVCWEPVPHFVVMSKLPVWPLTRTPAFKATRRSLVKTLKSGNTDPELPDLTDGARRTIAPGSSELTPAEPTAAVSELQVPLSLANHGVAARQNRFRSK